MKDESIFLHHLLDAIVKIEMYVEGKTKQDFISSTLIQDGTIRQFQIIGEASKRISEETRNKYPNIPWKDMCGMRDKLIHDYFGVDTEAVWETIQKDLPNLKTGIQAILK